MYEQNIIYKKKTINKWKKQKKKERNKYNLQKFIITIYK